MYQVGDKIVYPMHGAGVIESIEEREVLGKKQMYYIMRMPAGDMTAMIPTVGCDEIGVRFVISREEAQKVLEALEQRLYIRTIIGINVIVRICLRLNRVIFTRWLMLSRI